MHFASQELLHWHTPPTPSQDTLTLTTLSVFHLRIQYRISVIFLIFFYPHLFPLQIFLLISPTKIRIFTSEVCFSFTGVYLANDRRQKGDGVFSAAASEVSKIPHQLSEIAHCLVSSFEVHIRKGCICVHRYASTTGVILGLKLSLIHALKWNRLLAVWVFWPSGTLCWI